MTLRRWLAWPLAGFLLVAGGACGLFRMLGLEAEQRPFSHRNHGKEQELECSSCHSKAAKEAQAGMPASLKRCMLCHEGIDEKKPAERKLAMLYPGEKPVFSDFTELPTDVIFSHKAHLDKKVACAECHKGIEESESVTAAVRVSKDACMACHAERKAPNDCATCHKETRADIAPASHRNGWKRLHGEASRAGGGPPFDNRCSLCHTQATCTSCHQDEAPQNHTNFWRIQGHGLSAGVDRTACATCHRSDFCDRCHRETAPRNHTGAWGAPRDLHCVSCHQPLKAEPGCSMCHQGTPDHDLAIAKPAWHTAGMDCRQCHGNGQPLPHADNGSDCNSCHH